MPETQKRRWRRKDKRQREGSKLHSEGSLHGSSKTISYTAFQVHFLVPWGPGEKFNNEKSSYTPNQRFENKNEKAMFLKRQSWFHGLKKQHQKFLRNHSKFGHTYYLLSTLRITIIPDYLKITRSNKKLKQLEG